MAEHVRAIVAIAAFMLIATSCRKPAPSSTQSPDRVPMAKTLPTTPSLEIAAKVTEPGMVEFTVTTNLPTPLVAMASLDLQDQKDTDTAIGTSSKITLTGSTTTFTLRAIDDDDGVDGKALPSGRYDADVIVGSKWEENKSIASLSKNLEAKQTLELRSSRSRVAVERQNELQKWVIDNVPSDALWNEQKFKAKLGPYEKSTSTLSPLHDAYYFSNADMTLIVNRLRQEVSVWRMGRAVK